MADRRPEESKILQSLHNYLDEQDEMLDGGDLENLGQFLSATPASPLQEDWSRILASLTTLAQKSPLAAKLESELRTRIRTPQDIARAFAEKVAAISPKPKLAILVGAGASCSKPSEIPVVRDFLPMLWNKAAEIGHRPLLRIRDQCERLGVRNIEDLLTAITLAQAAMGNRITLNLVTQLIGARQSEPPEEEAMPPRIPYRALRRRVSPVELVDSGVVDSLRDSIQTLFSVLVGMMVGKPPNDAHKSIARLCAALPDTTVITTNYDTCLESALGEGAYTYGLATSRESAEPGAATARLAKLHGSLNWYSCLNCHRFFPARLDEINRTFAQGLYPIISICPSCQATAQQLIVPPIAQKYHDHPMLLDVRRMAEEAFRKAQVILIVGYSFSEADEYILRMISRAVQENLDKTFVLLDTESQPYHRLAKFLQTHVRTFKVKGGVELIQGDANLTAPIICGAVEASLKEKD